MKTAPKVSRRLYNVLSALRLWNFFVRMLLTYASIVPVSRIVYLDGIDGGPVREYLHRWHIIPRNPWFNIYLHHFLRGDDDRANHDHPWWSCSLLLTNMYREHTQQFCVDARGCPDIDAVMRANHECLDMAEPNDGRTYVEGSITANTGKLPGLHTAEYIQTFTFGDMRVLPPEHLHRIELAGNNDSPCWTLFVTGRRRRRWSFMCMNRGWVDFEEYTAPHPTKPNATMGCD